MIYQDQCSTPAISPTRRQVIAGTATAFACAAFSPISSWAAAENGLTHSAEAIHQEPVFQASRNRVYEALTDAGQFDKVMRLSAAMQSMATGTKPAEISREVGGAFSLFGGYVVGRHLELEPNQRIVQAWRSAGWKPSEYSIVRFELTEQGSATKIIFDHRGFPEGTGPHLVQGWNENYWQPLEKYLKTQSK